MPPDRAPAVLHITAAAGGGADRYIRDLEATSARRHYLLHVGPTVDVLEDIGARQFLPLTGLGSEHATSALSRWRDAADVGIAHLHGVDEACRKRLDAFRRTAALPYLVTLHDLLFTNPRAFEAPGMPVPDAAWIGELAPTLTGATTVIAPSAFLLKVAVDTVPGIRTTVIAPGLGPPVRAPTPPAPPDFTAVRPRDLVAVVGAIGPHKGSKLLDGLTAALDGTGIGLAVIGYTDTHLTRGWVVPGRFYVHGPYADAALAAWLAAYGATLVLFPNRLPESFSYTLSEVWAAGIPVIVPDDGALGARVAKYGGGWRLTSGFTPAEAAALIAHLLSDKGAAEIARVKSEILPCDPLRAPTIETMSREIDALYAHYAVSRSVPADPVAAQEALTPLLAANLNGFLFRKELLNLASQLQQAEKGLDAARHRCAQLEHDGAAWAAKLEVDIATLRGELTSERERLDAEIRRLAAENSDIQERSGRLAAENTKLEERSGRLVAEKAQVDERLRQLVAGTARLEEERHRQDDHALGLAAMNARAAEENRRLAEENARVAEENRRLAEENGRTAGLNARLTAEIYRSDERNRDLAAGNERQEGEVRRFEELARAQEQTRAEMSEALRASEQRERESIALAARLEHDKEAIRRELTTEVERLGEDNRRLAEHKAALDLLPAFVRSYLQKRIVRDRR